MAKDEDLPDELPELDQKEGDYDLLPEGTEYVAKVDFKSIIFRQYDRTARSATLGDAISFSNGVATLKALCAPYFDKKFNERMKELEDKYEEIMNRLSEESEGDDRSKSTNQQLAGHFQSEKLSEIFEEIGLLLKRQNVIR